ncbi:1 [Hexamita inflata]|uniref:alpha-amylase n=1 Tax=Hexamita inflata TaxID=28002 RepID=A0AA86TQE5_9EUKA|nr:1 [Hexamita inflata] [Hexamita inflata]
MLITMIQVFAYPDAKEFRKRRIYQLMTDRFASVEQKPCVNLHEYCGGTYNAMVQKLDYIKNLGYNAIWISPTIDQAENATNLYHGYSFSDFYKPNLYFGTEEELQTMIAEAHKRDIWVVADVVYNHVGACKGGRLDFSCIKTFSKPEYFNPDCDITNYSNQTNVINCRLCALPDLNQHNEFVHDELLRWAQWYINHYNFDGYRVDTVKHIDHDFWKDLRKVTPWFNIAEIFDGDYDFIKSFTNEQEVQTAFNYPLMFNIQGCIGGGDSMTKLSYNFEKAYELWGEDVRDLGVFFENHDNPRFLSLYNDLKRYENALTLIHTWIGIPVLYYGAEQDMTGGADPDNRHALWELGYSQTSTHFKFIQNLNKLRSKFPMDTLDQKELYATNDFYAFSRGNKIVTALTNTGNKFGQVHIRVPNTPFEPNSRVCNVNYPGDCLSVNSDRSLDVYLNNGEAKVFVREADAE